MATQLNGIQLGTNFLLQAEKPLDARQFYDTLEEMVGMEDTSLYEGITAYVKETDCTYQFKSSNEIDEETGKWRLFGAAESESNSKVTIIEGKTAPDAYSFGDVTLTQSQYTALVSGGVYYIPDGDFELKYTPASEDGTAEKFTLNNVEVTPTVVPGKEEYAKVYEFYQGNLETDDDGKPVADEDKLIGKINIPLDMVVNKGYYSKVYVDAEEESAWYYVDGIEAEGQEQNLDYAEWKDEKAVIVLHIANTDNDRITIPVSDLRNDEKEVKVYELFEDLPTDAEIDTLAYVKTSNADAEPVGKFYYNVDNEGNIQNDSYVVEIDGTLNHITGVDDCAQYISLIKSKKYDEAKEFASGFGPGFLAGATIEGDSVVVGGEAVMPVKAGAKYDILAESRPAGLYVYTEKGWTTQDAEVEIETQIKVYNTYDDLPADADVDTLAYVKTAIDPVKGVEATEDTEAVEAVEGHAAGMYIYTESGWITQDDVSGAHWIGTKEEYEVVKDSIKPGTVVIITDDEEDPAIIERIEDDDILALFE